MSKKNLTLGGTKVSVQADGDDVLLTFVKTKGVPLEKTKDGGVIVAKGISRAELKKFGEVMQAIAPDVEVEV